MAPKIPESSIKSAFTRDVVTLVKGTTIALVITTIASPIITRLYGPEAFGLFALFSSITGVFGVIACLRYEAAIMLPKSDKDAANVLGLCLLVGVLVSLSTIPALIVLQQPLTESLHVLHLRPFLWLIPPTLLITAIFLAMSSWNTRNAQFDTISTARIATSFASTGTQLGAGVLGYASGGFLIGANIIGQIVATFILGIHVIREHLSFFRRNITWSGIVAMLKKYSNFPKYDAGAEFINTLSWQIPIFLLAYFFSTTIVGYFSLGMTIVYYPMTLLGAAIAQVFFLKAAKAKHDGSLSVIVKDIFSLLIKISLFPFLLLTFIGRDLFVLIFGSSWGEAGFYIQILSIWGIFLFTSSPISSILSIEGKQKIGLVLSTINLVTRFLSICIGGFLGVPAIAILLFSVSGIVVYGVNGVYFMHLAGVGYWKTITLILKNFLVFLPAGIIMVFVKILNLGGISEIIFATILLIIYFGYLIKTDMTIHEILRDHTFGKLLF